MTRVLLARHAETVLSTEDRFAGSSDVQLSAEGRIQAESLARRLANIGIDAVYCSGLQRAVETAAIIAAPHALTPIARDGLREIDHGQWEGMRRTEVQSLYPAEYAAWEQDPLNAAPTGGEPGYLVLARALESMREIVPAHRGHTIMVVSHKATIRLLIATLLGFDPQTYRDRLEQSPACLNILEFTAPTAARLMLFNDVSHYDPLPFRVRSETAASAPRSRQT